MSLLRHTAPEFTAESVSNGDFKTVSLSDYRGQYVVLFFYPMDFTFVCPTELWAFQEALEKFKELNCQVLGVSTDSKFAHHTWLSIAREDGGVAGLTFPLVADPTHSIARDYGVLINEGEDAGVAYRGLFVIDPEGKVRICQIYDLPIGRNVEEVIRTVQALQLHAEEGEVCPANWQPGQSTMVPDPEGSRAYFLSSEELPSTSS